MGEYIDRNKLIDAIENITWWSYRNGGMQVGAKGRESAWLKAQDVHTAIIEIPGESQPYETWLSKAKKLLPNMDAADVMEALCPDCLFGKEETRFPETEGICPSWSDGNCVTCWTSPTPDFMEYDHHYE